MGACQEEAGGIVSFVARTSTGKSTVQRLAASVWGTTREGAGLVRTWEASPTKIETDAETLTDCVYILDDTAKVQPRYRDSVGALVYQLANGAGRGRGRGAGGSDAIRTWRLVSISSGEAPLATFGGMNGASARVIEVFGAPMDSADQAQWIDDATSAHYGHLGPRVVRWLQRHWDAVRALYEEHRAEWQGQHTGVAGRLGRLVALLRVAARAVHRVGVPEPSMDVWAWLAAEVVRHAADSDRARAAWDVYEGRLAWERGTGRWSVSEAVPVSEVVRWLEDAGFVPAAPVMAEWRGRGWVESDSRGGFARSNGTARVVPRGSA
jgi:uncharacterized protein (DUF927 family)